LPKVLLTMRLMDDVLEMLRRNGMELRINPHGRAFTPEELLEEVRTVDGVILGMEKFDRKVMDHSQGLKVIGRYGVGYDNVEVPAATEKGIYVTYTPCVLCDAVADETLGLIICAARRLPQADAYVKAKRWGVGWPAVFPLGVEVTGKTLGIVGLGRIGSRIVPRAKGFGMKIIYHDTRRTETMMRLEKEYDLRRVSLEELLRESDFVTLHVPLNEPGQPPTRGMIGARELSMMKKTAYLINTSRGPIVDQRALYPALKEGKIAGAALDVFEKEPISPDDPLLGLDNVILAPHIASATVETRHAMAVTVAEDVVRVLKGEQPRNVVNRELLERS